MWIFELFRNVEQGDLLFFDMKKDEKIKMLKNCADVFGFNDKIDGDEG